MVSNGGDCPFQHLAGDIMLLPESYEDGDAAFGGAIQFSLRRQWRLAPPCEA
jgi:hypothetical protein